MISGNDKMDIELLKADPNLFIENTIKDYVATSPLNRIITFDNMLISEEPIVAFANGDDSLFNDFKTIIGDHHITPREAFEKYIERKGWRYGQKSTIENLSVISYAMPISYETRLSERQTSLGGSPRYNHSRWRGEIFRSHLSNYVVSLLELMGCNAVAPSYARLAETQSTPDGFLAGWSERHIAYACGLGTFGLNGLMITSKGCAVYLNSVVCDLVLIPTPRVYDSHVANCLFYRDGSCRQCLERCAEGAISEQGRSNIKCRENLGKNQAVKLKELGLDKEFIGLAPSCGLCSTNVPCEDRIPASVTDKN